MRVTEARDLKQIVRHRGSCPAPQALAPALRLFLCRESLEADA